MKILFVEDEKEIVRLLENAIGGYFAEFHIASNGKDGIRKFKEISPDIIITDIMMPELNGLDMAKELKKINSKVPIVVLSAFSDKDKLLNAIDVGIVKYFIKPFDPDELLEYLDNMCEQITDKIVFLIDNFKFNKITNNLYKGDKYIDIANRETEFLQLLLENSKDIIDNKMIKKVLWKDDTVSDDRVRTFIKRFRAKTSTKLVKNTKAYGYKITLE